ncbi:uncharacterized protein LOC132720157 [Ruditapes philippinarum]|uniref:uncharacterized protein LOC132720157 n=1 Tax=Ruditapes philippinarum TaxID=129788 RepID=UPI00295AE5B8|nr:uncharacterized protein LOC132720157 [Ruditapes philippinarum]
MMEIIQVEDIGQCRSGPDNDIDLQAVYGGRFSGRKEKDLKINPVYSDVNNVNQFSDINGNMSPVHVVTYETFPRSRKDKIPSENGKIQNGDAIQTLRINLTENDNNNLLHKEKHDNSKGFIDKDRNNENHVGETKNQKLCKGNGNLNHLNELSCKSSNKASSELVNGHDNQQTDTKIHVTADTDSIHSTTDQEVQTKAYFKDYGLLGYSNGSFVLDETHIIIETKPTEVENPKKQSINEIHTNCSDVINHEETKCVHLENSKVNCENSNCVKKEQPTVAHSQQNSQTETIIISDLPESTYQEISDLCDLNTPISEGLCSPRDLSVNTSEDLPNPCESPQICPTEIVTEVLVHNSAVNETPIMHYREKYSENDNMCHSFDTDKIQSEVLSQTGDSDWPDIDVLARKPDDGILYQSTDEIAQNDGNKVDSPGHVRSISDVILQDKDRNKSSVNNQGDPCSGQNSDGSSLYKKNEKKSNSCSKSCVR